MDAHTGQRNPVAWIVLSKRSTPCRDKTVPATKPPVAWTVLSKRSTPCRDKTVPATKPPVAWTVLSKRSTPCRDKTVPATKLPVAWTVLSKRSTPCRDKTVPATKLPVAWTVLSKRSTPCRDKTVPATRFFEHPQSTGVCSKILFVRGKTPFGKGRHAGLPLQICVGAHLCVRPFIPASPIFRTPSELLRVFEKTKSPHPLPPSPTSWERGRRLRLFWLRAAFRWLQVRSVLLHSTFPLSHAVGEGEGGRASRYFAPLRPTTLPYSDRHSPATPRRGFWGRRFWGSRCSCNRGYAGVL
ncbi:MAG: hypothetical protein KatS3mg020_0189 [Fimbriimonadales bacterium]|nr:MAG: hypothetical protein KatS3mg020_0189 [Fimbriimonadales bacterium]